MFRASVPTMPNWRDVLSRVADEISARANVAHDMVRARIGEAPLSIASHHGFGTRDRLFVQGRALRGAALGPAGAEDSAWRNLAAMYRRMEADPLPRAEVVVRAGGAERQVVADDEGFFRAWVTPAAPAAPESGWLEAEMDLMPRGEGEIVRATARLRVPGPHARFAVVSDVDDTVLQSNVHSLVAAMRTALLSNARTRLPFPGVAAFYRALERGASGAEGNPVFYLSSSPWNLFDLLAEFLEVQRLPAGPLLLRDWDVTLDALGNQRLHGYKGANLRELLSLYPTLPFILVGDTTQQDPEIYASVVHDHPGRVLAVYIRDVTRTPQRSAAVAALAAELEKAQVPLVLAPDTLGAARHAAERGWIDPAALDEIDDDAEKDEGTKPGKEEA